MDLGDFKLEMENLRQDLVDFGVCKLQLAKHQLAVNRV